MYYKLKYYNVSREGLSNPGSDTSFHVLKRVSGKDLSTLRRARGAESSASMILLYLALCITFDIIKSAIEIATAI